MNKMLKVLVAVLAIVIIVALYVFFIKNNDDAPALQIHTPQADITKAKVGSAVVLSGKYIKGDFSKATYVPGKTLPYSIDVSFLPDSPGTNGEDEFRVNFTNLEEAEKLFGLTDKKVDVEKSVTGKIETTLCNYGGKATIEVIFNSVEEDSFYGVKVYNVTLNKIIKQEPDADECFTIDGSI